MSRKCFRCGRDVALAEVTTEGGAVWHLRCYHEDADTRMEDGKARPMSDDEKVAHRKWADETYGPLPTVLVVD